MTAEFAKRASGHWRALADPEAADVLLAEGIGIPAASAYVTLWDDRELAEESVRSNREDYDHDVIGPITRRDGWLQVLDLRRLLAAQALTEPGR